MEENRVVITRENIKDIAEKLAKKEGKLLIAEPGPGSYKGDIVDVCLNFYDHALINPSIDYFYTERGTDIKEGEPWQTGWEGDREYLLFPCRSGDSAKELFERLRLENYEFRIGFQANVAGSIFPSHGLPLYVPPGDEALEQALIFGLKHVINQMQEQDRVFLSGLIEKMVDYAIGDLKDNKIFQENVGAGREADII